MIIFHIAGEMIEGVQRCTRCGEILIDYRNSAVAIMPGEPLPRMSGWAQGAFIAIAGNCSLVRERDAENLAEQRCDERVQ